MTHGEDPDAGKDWRPEEKGTTEDEMVGWHHRLDGHEFEQAPGVGDGQGGLACCGSWGLKESDTTERLNWTGSVFLCLPCPLLHLWHCDWEQKLWGETEIVLGSEHFHVLTVWYCKEPSMVLKKWLSYLSFKIQFRGNRPCASYLAIPFSPKLTLLYWLCDAGPGFCLACGHPLQDWKKNKGLPFSWVRPSGCLLLGTSNTCSPSCGFLEFFLSYFNHRTVNLQCCLISALQQNDSVICIYWHIFSIVVYYRILKSVPCGIQ